MHPKSIVLTWGQEVGSDPTFYCTLAGMGDEIGMGNNFAIEQTW